MGVPRLAAKAGERPRRSEEWTDAMSGLQMPLGSSLGRVWTRDETIADARNALCKAAIESGVEYLFMLGDDVLPPPNALLTMLEKIGRSYPVGRPTAAESADGNGVAWVNDGRSNARAGMITGVYWTKTYPPEPY